MAWLPASFLPAETLRDRPAAPCTARCGPGGLLLTGTLDPQRRRMARRPSRRLRLTLWGGGTWRPDEVVAMVRAAGYVDVTAVPRQSGRLVPIHARRAG